jgi:hypothetical protein
MLDMLYPLFYCCTDGCIIVYGRDLVVFSVGRRTVVDDGQSLSARRM